MRRREFITVLGGGAATWPLATRAQQLENQRRIGMLVGFDDADIKTFHRELERLGWSEGRNIHIDYRYAPAGTQVQSFADAIAGTPNSSLAVLPDSTTTINRDLIINLAARHSLPSNL